MLPNEQLSDKSPFSSTVTSQPSAAKNHAELSPAMPPPMMVAFIFLLSVIGYLLFVIRYSLLVVFQAGNEKYGSFLFLAIFNYVLVFKKGNGDVQITVQKTN